MTYRSLLLISLLIPLSGVSYLAGVTPAAAATDGLSRNAWVPYWKADGGIAEASRHLDGLTSVSPFSFEVTSDGTVVDRLGLDDDRWADFLEEAEDEGVAIYPSVSWFDGNAIDDVLSNSRSRRKHVDEIMRKVIRAHPEADGVEIDYEGKLAATKDDFSQFLSDLKKKLKAKKKKLICDVEARTPLDARYAVVTPQQAASVAYANDYKAIGSACDEVRVMAYDQGLADVKLVRAGAGPYAPVSDVAWVAKVMASTTSDIAPGKVVMGIPTYGAVYRIDASGGYSKISSITYVDALKLAVKQGVAPTRNRSGELAFSYTGLTSGLPGNATPTGVVNRYFVTFSDSGSVAAHVALARRLGLGGVALFKMDGDTDPAALTAFLK